MSHPPTIFFPGVNSKIPLVFFPGQRGLEVFSSHQKFEAKNPPSLRVVEPGARLLGLVKLDVSIFGQVALRELVPPKVR